MNVIYEIGFLLVLLFASGFYLSEIIKAIRSSPFPLRHVDGRWDGPHAKPNPSKSISLN